MEERDIRTFLKPGARAHLMGIGGVSMEPLAEVLFGAGVQVTGSDMQQSEATAQLEALGIPVAIGHRGSNVAGAELVIRTAAVHDDNPEVQAARAAGVPVFERSQAWGAIMRDYPNALCVAGTHGKTTTTTLVAWLNREVAGGGSAFLGGISRNFDNNLVLGAGDRLAVEADEFDRSFLRLSPDAAVITSADADHLDIYGTHEAVKEAFSQFVSRIKSGGALVIKKGVDIKIENDGIRVWRYSLDEPCDFYASRIESAGEGRYRYDITTPDGVITDCVLGIPGRINIENSIAAAALMWCAAQHFGERLDAELLRRGLAGFEGVKRRFECYVNTPSAVYIDDYAHHPRELAAAIMSVKGMYPSRKVTAVFQPHLYTRTRDLYAEFAEALSKADEVVLLPIYPAREEPIEGITTEIIAERVTVPCRITDREHLAAEIESMPVDVVVTFGAGNIDACCEAVAGVMRRKGGGC